MAARMGDKYKQMSIFAKVRVLFSLRSCILLTRNTRLEHVLYAHTLVKTCDHHADLFMRRSLFSG